MINILIFMLIFAIVFFSIKKIMLIKLLTSPKILEDNCSGKTYSNLYKIHPKYLKSSHCIFEKNYYGYLIPIPRVPSLLYSNLHYWYRKIFDVIYEISFFSFYKYYRLYVPLSDIEDFIESYNKILDCLKEDVLNIYLNFKKLNEDKTLNKEKFFDNIQDYKKFCKIFKRFDYPVFAIPYFYQEKIKDIHLLMKKVELRIKKIKKNF